jgi:hypothetical protein
MVKSTVSEFVNILTLLVINSDVVSFKNIVYNHGKEFFILCHYINRLRNTFFVRYKFYFRKDVIKYKFINGNAFLLTNITIVDCAFNVSHTADCYSCILSTIKTFVIFFNYLLKPNVQFNTPYIL